MRKLIKTIHEEPVSYIDTPNSGYSWLYINPTNDELDSILKEFKGIPSVRILVKNKELVIAHGWYWTHDDMLKHLRKPAKEYGHFHIDLLHNKISVGKHMIYSVPDGEVVAIKLLKNVLPKLTKLNIIDRNTTLTEWGDFTGKKLYNVKI